MTTTEVQRMGFASTADQNLACKEIIRRQAKATPPQMGRGREALVNGIEACRRAARMREAMGIKKKYTPEIYIGAHPSFPHLFCIADNGCGMSYEEAERHLASIGCSGNAIACVNDVDLYLFDDNKGVGVKISLLPSNPGGLQYVSAPLTKDKDKDVFWYKLGMDEEGYPGFVMLDERDGYAGEEVTTHEILDWENEKDNMLNFPHIRKAGHGTVLTLFGNDRTGATPTVDNEGVFHVRAVPKIQRYENDYTLLSYINKRFWDLSDIKVTVNLGKMTCQAIGAEAHLNRSKVKGETTVTLKDGTPVKLCWWILPLGNGSDVTAKHLKTWARSGHCATKFRGELYWNPLNSFNDNKKDLRNFGIFAGHEAICLYLDLDSIPHKKQAKITSNESRTMLYYDQSPLDLGKDNIGDQFVDLLNAKHPDVIELLNYMEGETPPQLDSKEADNALKNLFKRMNFFQPLDKRIKHALKGELIAAANAEPEEVHTKAEPIGIRPIGPTPTPRKVHPVKPKGKDGKGIEDWVDELPKFIWSDEVNPSQTVEYNKVSVNCFTQSERFQFLLKSTMNRVRKNASNIPDGRIIEVSERLLKNAIKAQILSYIYVSAGYAKASKQNFDMLKRDVCDERVLESQLMLNVTVQDQLTKAIQKELTNGN